VRATALEAYAHQDAPFDAVVEALHVERDPSVTPLFQTMLVVRTPEETLTEVRAGDLTLSAIDLPTASSLFNLTLTVSEAEQGLDAVLAYSADVFDESTAVRVAGHFEALLHAALGSPDRSLSEVSW